MAAAELSNILWRERHLLDLLQFKLVEHQLLIAAGRVEWLVLASDEVERVADELRHVELLRAIEADVVAAELGLAQNPSLAELAAAAAEPWRGILEQHRAALITAAGEVRSMSEVSRDLLRNGDSAIRELTRALDAVSYAGARTDSPPLLLDQVV